MWYILLVITVGLSLSALLYVSLCLAQTTLIQRLSALQNRQKAIAFFLALAFFALISLWLNLMNAVICLLYLAVFWLLSKLILHRLNSVFKADYAAISAVILTLLSLSFGWYQNHRIYHTAYQLQTDKQIAPLRLAFFADSHIGTTFDAEGFAKHLAFLEQQKPDIIFIVGDFVDDSTTKEEMIAACRALGRLSPRYGVYYTFGNHDKGYHNPAIRGFTAQDLAEELQKNNIIILEDEIKMPRPDFYVIGRKDASENLRRNPRQNMPEITADLDKEKYMIVLDHQPNDYKAQAASGVDLVLSDHTHGGQLWPLNKIGEWIGANDHTYGHIQKDKTDFIVTSGLSDWAIRFKTGTKSEFVTIDLQRTAN